MPDSKRFLELQHASTRDVKAVGMIGASTGLEMVEYIRRLEDLVIHCWIHSGYKDCGYGHMDSEQKAVYDGIIASNSE